MIYRLQYPYFNAQILIYESGNTMKYIEYGFGLWLYILEPNMYSNHIEHRKLWHIVVQFWKFFMSSHWTGLILRNIRGMRPTWQEGVPMGKENIIEQLCWTALLTHQDYAARMVENPGSVKYIEILQICFNTSRTRPKLILPNSSRMSLPVYHRLYLEMLSHAWENNNIMSISVQSISVIREVGAKLIYIYT